MIDHFLNAIEHVVLRYGSFGIFSGVFIEEVISIVPSVGVVMSAGFFFLGGHPLNLESFGTLFFHIAIPAAAGLTLGSLFIYSIVYAFGRDIIIRFGKYIYISWQDIEKLRHFMQRHTSFDSWTLFGVRAIPLVPFSVTNVFCGLVRWRPLSFITITFFGAIVRTSIIGFIGWQLGQLYKANIVLFRQIEWFIGLIIVVFLITYLVYRHIKRKRNIVPPVT
ncbi:MAG: VTT domain-containing protein [bacterium]|nr:VTT domain-containing protein [bacterium]